jgi:hypothetical protein
VNKVTKPAQAPAILRNRGADETAENETAFDADRQAHLNGTKTFDFDNGIYGATSVAIPTLVSHG